MCRFTLPLGMIDWTSTVYPAARETSTARNPGACTVPVRGNVVSGRVLAPAAERDAFRVTEIGLPRSSQSTTAMPIAIDLAVPSAVMTSVPAWAVRDTGARLSSGRAQ